MLGTVEAGDVHAQGRHAVRQEHFRPDIEGLRAVAVVAVVLFHAGVPGVGGGFVGVDVFFVISGFLITGLLLRELRTAGTVRLSRFYGARARRLLPASAFVGVITAIGAAILLPPLQARTVFGDGIASALYVSNYRFVLQNNDYFAPRMPPSPYQHYWSLGVEEQFYLVWPALIIATAWLIRRARKRKAHAKPSDGPYLVVLALVAAGSFALFLAADHVMPALAFYSLPTRAWQLAVGGLVALTVGQWRRLPRLPAAIAGWTGLALILVACVLLGGGTLYSGIAALLPVLGATLVIGAGCASASQGCGRVLGLSPMRWVGRVSYSWYLWHWPVLLLAPFLLHRELGLSGRLVAAAVSLALAVLTLHFIENPLRFATPLRQSATRSLTLGAVATIVAVCVGVALLVVTPAPVGRGAPAAALRVTAPPLPPGQDIAAYNAAVDHAFAQVQSAVEASANLNAVPSNLDPPLADVAAEISTPKKCLTAIIQVTQPNCVLTGDANSATTVALIGDSNAVMWGPPFQQVAERRGWRLELLAKATCPLMDLRVFNPYLHRDYTECEQWRGNLLARLRVERPSLIVVSMSRHYGPAFGFTSYDPAWIEGLTRLVQELRAIAPKVLVLGPIPDPQSQLVAICLSDHLEDATACSPPRSTAVNDPGIAAEAAATEAGGGQYADITSLFCTAERCPVIVGNNLVYRDGDHVTFEYADVLAPVVGALADRALAGG